MQRSLPVESRRVEQLSRATVSHAGMNSGEDGSVRAMPSRQDVAPALETSAWGAAIDGKNGVGGGVGAKKGDKKLPLEPKIVDRRGRGRGRVGGERREDAQEVSLYVPPFRARQQEKEREEDEDADRDPDKENLRLQEAGWGAMKKAIIGVVNRVNADNVRECTLELFRLNLIRGKGVFCKALQRAQVASPDFSSVYAALVAVVNTRMPEVTALLLDRLVDQLKVAYESQDRIVCFCTARFFAHLFNQQVVNELLLLEFISSCLMDPSDGSTELVVTVLRECGVLMSERAPRALEHVFQKLREVLHDNLIGHRTQVMVEGLMELRRKKFREGEVLPPSLDLVEDEDAIPHFPSLEDEDTGDILMELNAFRIDPMYDENERLYDGVRLAILGPDRLHRLSPAVVEAAPATDEGMRHVERNWALEAPAANKNAPSTDMTEADLVNFRRTVYLSIMSAASYEECAHKLRIRMFKNPGKEGELCNMIIECCIQEKTFLRYYGLLGQRFCMMNRTYVARFEEAFATHYATIHRLDTRKIRNLGNFYASLLSADALPWSLLELVHLSEEETTASSRIFLKILFQEMARTLGTSNLVERFRDEDVARHLTGVLPTDSPQMARFAINFFTSIGLGELTEDLRERLQSMRQRPVRGATSSSSSDSSSSTSSSDTSSSSVGSLSQSGGDDGHREESAKRNSGKRHADSMSPSPSPRASKYPRSHTSPADVGQDRRWRPSPADGVEPRGAQLMSGLLARDASFGRGHGRGLRGSMAGNAAPGMGRGRGRDLTRPAWMVEGDRVGPSSNDERDKRDREADSRGAEPSQRGSRLERTSRGMPGDRRPARADDSRRQRGAFRESRREREAGSYEGARGRSKSNGSRRRSLSRSPSPRRYEDTSDSDSESRYRSRYRRDRYRSGYSREGSHSRSRSRSRSNRYSRSRSPHRRSSSPSPPPRSPRRRRSRSASRRRSRSPRRWGSPSPARASRTRDISPDGTQGRHSRRDRHLSSSLSPETRHRREPGFRYKNDELGRSRDT